jgi:hypothetical protein
MTECTVRMLSGWEAGTRQFPRNIAHHVFHFPGRDYIVVCGKNVNFCLRPCCFILCVMKVHIFAVLLSNRNLHTFGECHFYQKSLYGSPHQYFHFSGYRGSLPGVKRLKRDVWPLTSVYRRGWDWMELYFYFFHRPSLHVQDNFAIYRISIVIKYEDGLFWSGVMFIPNYWIKILPFVPRLLQGDENMDMKP